MYCSLLLFTSAGWLFIAKYTKSGTFADKLNWMSALQSIWETVATACSSSLRLEQNKEQQWIVVTRWVSTNTEKTARGAKTTFGIGGMVVSSLATTLFSRCRHLVGVTSNFSNNKYFAIQELHALLLLCGSIRPWWYSWTSIIQTPVIWTLDYPDASQYYLYI